MGVHQSELDNDTALRAGSNAPSLISSSSKFRLALVWKCGGCGSRLI